LNENAKSVTLWSAWNQNLPFGREGECQVAMKATLINGWKLAVVLVSVPLLIGTAQEPNVGEVASESAPPIATETASPVDSGPASGQITAQTMLPAPVVARLSPTAQEIVRLAQSGVSEEVILAYIAGSTSPFGLGSDQIIYLNDLGIPAAVVKAMIQRDTALAQTSTVAATPVASSTDPGNTPPTDTNVPPPPDAQPPDYPTDYTDDGTGPYQTPDVTSDYFYSVLAPYGNWIFVPGFGRCWQPMAGSLNRGWQPYCDQGCWIYTDRGWYWRSGYSWGWAPFHYGRWWQDEHHGWVWLPGHVWGPAWVCWRHSADYCGWAPLPPGARVVAGVGLTWRNHPVGPGFDFGLTASQYTFVPISHLADGAPSQFRIPQQQIPKVFQQTTAINRFGTENGRVINRGVEVGQVVAASRHPIRRLTIRNMAVPVGGASPPPGIGGPVGGMTVVHPRSPSQDFVRSANPGGFSGNNDGRPTPPTFIRPTPSQSLILHGPQPISSSAPTPGMVRSGMDADSLVMRREEYPANSIILRGPQSPPSPPYQPRDVTPPAPAPIAGVRPTGAQPYAVTYPTPAWQAAPTARMEPTHIAPPAPEYHPPQATVYSEPVRPAPAAPVRSEPVSVERYSPPAPAPAPAPASSQSQYSSPAYRSGH
jgi:hypothetical protein